MTETYDRRPAELTVRNASDRRVIVAVAEDADSRGRPMLHGLEPGGVYLFPGRVAEATARDYSAVKLVHEPRGALPLTWAPDANTRQARLWANGPVAPSFAERVEAIRSRHDLPDLVTSTAVVRLAEAGFDETEAVTFVRETYELAQREQGLFRMDWGTWTDELVASREGAEV